MEIYVVFLIGIGGGVFYMIIMWFVLFKFKVDDFFDVCVGIYIVRFFVVSNIFDMDKKYFIKIYYGIYFLM